MFRLRGIARTTMAAGALAMLECAPAIAQQAPVAPSSHPQCARNDEQITACARNLQQCSSSFIKMAEQRKALGSEVDALKARTCMQEPEPRWREIVRNVVDARLAGLKRTRTAASCEEFSYEIAANARVILKGRLRDRAPIQTAKSELIARLPGLDVDEQQVRAQDGDCLPPVADGHVMGVPPQPIDRDTIGQARLSKMPPASSCIELGAKMTQNTDIPADLRARIDEGFWVLDDGYAALCRRSPTAADRSWEVTRQNLERGMIILRESD